MDAVCRGACGNVGLRGGCRQKSSNQQGRSTFGVSRGSVHDRDGPSGFQDDQSVTVSRAGDIRNVPLLQERRTVIDRQLSLWRKGQFQRVPSFVIRDECLLLKSASIRCGNEAVSSLFRTLSQPLLFITWTPFRPDKKR